LVKFPVASGFVPSVATCSTESFLFIDHVVFDIARKLSDGAHFEWASGAIASQTHAG